MSDKDGGPAFPETENYGRPGMTLRDWFAGQALASVADNVEETVDDIADWAYRLADAMLKRREK